MSIRPALLQSGAGVLTLVPPELAADPTVEIVGGACAIYRPDGTVLVASREASLGNGELTLAVQAEETATLGRGYRVRWRYTVDGAAVLPKDRLFDVVTHVLDQPISTVGELVEYYPILRGRSPDPDQGDDARDQRVLIEKAWELLLNKIRALGNDPALIKDSSPLEPAHAALAASLIAVNYNLQAEDEGELAWSQARAAQCDRLLPECLAACDFYES